MITEHLHGHQPSPDLFWRPLPIYIYIYVMDGLQGIQILTYLMPCVRTALRQHRRFLPHFPPGSMRCRFSPELVPPLPHAMMHVFPKPEKDLMDDSSVSPPPSPLTPTASSPPLVPKPSGEVSRIGRGGYNLKDILEQQHGWEDGLYDKIRV